MRVSNYFLAALCLPASFGQAFAAGPIVNDSSCLYTKENATGLPGNEVLLLPEGSLFTGHFRNGEANGFGNLSKLNGLRYEAQWKHNKVNGNGVVYYPDGSCFEGVFVDGVLQNQGRMFYRNGKTYKGQLRNHMPHGLGVLKQDSFAGTRADFWNGTLKTFVHFRDEELDAKPLRPMEQQPWSLFKKGRKSCPPETINLLPLMKPTRWCVPDTPAPGAPKIIQN